MVREHSLNKHFHSYCWHHFLDIDSVSKSLLLLNTPILLVSQLPTYFTIKTGTFRATGFHRNRPKIYFGIILGCAC